LIEIHAGHQFYDTQTHTGHQFSDTQTHTGHQFSEFVDSQMSLRITASIAQNKLITE